MDTERKILVETKGKLAADDAAKLRAVRTLLADSGKVTIISFGLSHRMKAEITALLREDNFDRVVFEEVPVVKKFVLTPMCTAPELLRWKNRNSLFSETYSNGKPPFSGLALCAWGLRNDFDVRPISLKDTSNLEKLWK